MNIEALHKAINEVRNGANFFVRHPLCRNVQYSDGVQEVAKEGCYWVLELLATELPDKFKLNEEVSNQCIIKVRANGSRAQITAEFDDGIIAWRKAVEYTDLPDGVITLLMADDKDGPSPYKIILISEN